MMYKLLAIIGACSAVFLLGALFAALIELITGKADEGCECKVGYYWAGGWYCRLCGKKNS